jgi:uncharacterized membrane protein
VESGNEALPSGTSARVGWSLGALTVIFWGLRIWTGSTTAGWVNPFALALVLIGLVLGVWVFAASRPPGRTAQATIMLALVAAIAIWAYLEVLRQPAYGTDEVAFDQYAAELLRHGMNPYTHSLLPALQRFLVPPIYHTYLLSGGEVDHFSYPALSLLAYIPALLLGVRQQAAVFTDLAAWAGAFLLLWRLLPAGVGWAAALLLGFLTYANYVVGGVTDALFMPFLFLALWRWDRYGAADETGPARWLSPVALGLAASVKQTPWFIVPFLLVGLAQEGRARGGRAWLTLPAKYLAVAAIPFAALNLPFVVLNPAAWARGVVLPLLSPTVPGGQGLVNLSLFAQLGGNLREYTFAGAFALISALTAFALYYPSLKRALVPLVACVFFWPTRSFASYLIDLTPAAVLAATTVRPAPALSPLLGRIRPLIAALPVAALAVLVVLIVSSSPPLDVKVVGLRSTGQLRTIDGIRVRVTNRSSRPLRPHFAVINGGYLTSFWYALGSTTQRSAIVVRPHETTQFFLRAPNAQSMPSIEAGFVVEAFTASPATVSASKLVPPIARHLVISPSALNQPVRITRPVKLSVQLVNLLGNPVRQRGTLVALGQIIYGERSLLPGEASIDGRPEGETPITRRTDEQGRVNFTIHGVQAQSEPVFFQAWIAPARGAPTGFSNLLAIQFVER